MRINRFVALASGLSRRAADAAVTDGRVTVNGACAGIGWEVADGDHVALDGALLHAPEAHTYIMLNKPAGYITSRAKQGNAPTIYDLLPEKYHDLRPAGRLDRDSCGLVILSDDGDYIYLMTHPSQNKLKTYRLRLARALTAANIARLEEGIELPDGPSVVRVAATDGRWATVQLGEGRNRQLRRTFGAIGAGVITLQRVAMGGILLGDLPEGHYREIPVADIFGQVHRAADERADVVPSGASDSEEHAQMLASSMQRRYAEQRSEVKPDEATSARISRNHAR